MKKRAVVLLSGGLDSTTVCAIAQDFDIYALTVNYNQRHKVELEAARRVAEFFNVKKHVIIPLDLTLFGGSSLTTQTPVPKNVDTKTIGLTVPNTYVPARNTIFLSLALAFAEAEKAQDIFIGVSQVDFSGYPDCREVFLRAFNELANVATSSGTYRIHAPLLNLDKSAIIKLGLSLGVDYSITHTCYDPASDGMACGHCESCLLRRKGFDALGITDPVPGIGFNLMETHWKTWAFC